MKPSPRKSKTILVRPCVQIGDTIAIGSGKIDPLRIKVGVRFVVARLTERSSSMLGTAPGQRIWIQVKSAVLTE